MGSTVNSVVFLILLCKVDNWRFSSWKKVWIFTKLSIQFILVNYIAHYGVGGPEIASYVHFSGTTYHLIPHLERTGFILKFLTNAVHFYINDILEEKALEV